MKYPLTLSEYQDRLSSITGQLQDDEVVPAMRYLCRTDLYFLLRHACKRKDMENEWLFQRCREVQKDPNGFLDLWSRGHYKDLCLFTVVPTPDGFRLFRDVHPGDYVLSPSGHPTQVIAETPVFTDSDCYEVEFSRGGKIIAGGDHLWRVDINSRRRIPGEPHKRVGWEERVVTTVELKKEVDRANAKTTTTKLKPCIKATKTLQLPDKDLPVAPYTLGLWLGDGSSNGIGSKHIPEQYMFASEAQRRALAQGLLDSDGSVHKTHGQCTFCTKWERLAEQVSSLINSLGVIATHNKRIGAYKGEPYEYYQVTFTAYKSDRLFRLKRKSDRLLEGGANRQNSHRQVVRVTRTPSVPTKCIQVDDPEGMFLIGDGFIPTHNSTIITFGKTIQDILASHGEDALPEWGGREVTIGLFSHNRPMAKDFLRQIKQEFEENPRLILWFPDILYENPKGEALKWNEDSGLTVKRKSNPKEATVEAAGVVEGQPTGKHYVIRVYDDMVHEKYVTNPEIIERTTRMWANSLNLGDKDFNIERYIGTRYHLKDTYAEMIKRGAVKTRLHAATEDGQPDGKPVFFSREQLAAVRKNSGAHVFACQQLLDPLAEGISSFKESDLRYYEYRSGIEKSMNVYIVVDPASSKKKGSDYTVFWVIGLASDQNYYVLDVVRDRLNLRERGETLMRLHRRWRPLGVGYEKYGMQCDKEHIEYVQEEKTYRFNIEELGGSMSKKDRIRKLQPLFENKRIWLPEQVMYRNYEKKMVDLIEDFKNEEYISFPVGGHDDMLDSMARILDEDLMATFPLTDEEMDVGRGRATASSDRYNRRPRKSATAWAH